MGFISKADLALCEFCAKHFVPKKSNFMQIELCQANISLLSETYVIITWSVVTDSFQFCGYFEVLLNFDSVFVNRQKFQDKCLELRKDAQCHCNIFRDQCLRSENIRKSGKQGLVWQNNGYMNKKRSSVAPRNFPLKGHRKAQMIDRKYNKRLSQRNTLMPENSHGTAWRKNSSRSFREL